MLRTDRPRRGLTLTEVLIAMFIMAIGMIAIFTLFPLGAIKIGQALKDDRTSQTAIQADAYMRAYWRQEVIAKLGVVPGVTNVNEPFFGAMESGRTASDTPPAGTGFTDLVTPSFPVLIDPLGSKDRNATGDQRTVAFVASSGRLARRKLRLVTDPSAFNVAAMSDDLTFESNGAPSSVEPLTRQGRYSWAALVQRVVAQPRGSANFTVLVFDGRSRLPAITSGNAAYNDELMLAPVAPLPVIGDRQMTINVPERGADDPYLVREGGWVLDATIPATGTPTQVATFYRIVAVTPTPDDDNPRRVTLDLESPLKYPLTAQSNLYFFAGLSEVFERAPLGPDSNY